MADFTIEVKKKEKDEDFKFEDLEMYHQECYGGEIKIEVTEETDRNEDIKYALFKLTYTRCHRTIYLNINSNFPAEIIKTSIDGKEREIKGFEIERGEKSWNTIFQPLKILVKLKPKI
jgi:hypothetical protein